MKSMRLAVLIAIPLLYFITAKADDRTPVKISGNPYAESILVKTPAGAPAGYGYLTYTVDSIDFAHETTELDGRHCHIDNLSRNLTLTLDFLPVGGGTRIHLYTKTQILPTIDGLGYSDNCNEHIAQTHGAPDWDQFVTRSITGSEDWPARVHSDYPTIDGYLQQFGTPTH